MYVLRCGALFFNKVFHTWVNRSPEWHVEALFGKIPKETKMGIFFSRFLNKSNR
jgi:hypothetical protein